MAKEKSIYTCTECGGTQPEVAGQVPELRRLEHAGRGGRRRRRPGIASPPVARPDAGRAGGDAVGDRGRRRRAPADRHRRARPRARRRPRRRRRGADRRRPGHRQVDAAAAGARVAVARAPRCSTSPARRAAPRWRCARAGSAWRGSAVRVLAEIQLEKIMATIEAERPAVCVIDSIQTVYSEALTSAPGSVAQVRECAAQLTRLAKASGTTVDPGRPRHQGGRAGRAARAGAHRRHRALLRGRHPLELPPGAGDQEPVRRGQRDRRVRDDREGPEGRRQPERDLPVDPRRPGRRLLRAGHARGHAAAAGGDAGAGRHRRARARAGCRSASTATGWRCCWRCCTAMPASPRSTRTCSSTPSAACASASRRPTWR